MKKDNQLNGLIARTLGSKAALLRAMQRSKVINAITIKHEGDE